VTKYKIRKSIDTKFDSSVRYDAVKMCTYEWIGKSPKSQIGAKSSHKISIVGVQGYFPMRM